MKASNGTMDVLNVGVPGAPNNQTTEYVLPAKLAVIAASKDKLLPVYVQSRGFVVSQFRVISS